MHNEKTDGTSHGKGSSEVIGAKGRREESVKEDFEFNKFLVFTRKYISPR